MADAYFFPDPFPRTVILAATYIVDRLIPRHPDGFTWNSRRWQLVPFEPDDFVVSLDGYEQRFVRQPTVLEVATWLIAVSAELQHSNRFVGFWFEKKQRRYVFDVAMKVRGLAAALDAGGRHRQQEIYDATNNNCIAVPEWIPPRRRAA